MPSGDGSGEITNWRFRAAAFTSSLAGLAVSEAGVFPAGPTSGAESVLRVEVDGFVGFSRLASGSDAATGTAMSAVLFCATATGVPWLPSAAGPPMPPAGVGGAASGDVPGAWAGDGLASAANFGGGESAAGLAFG